MPGAQRAAVYCLDQTLIQPSPQVMEGRGVMLVTAVGPHSQQGRILQLLTQRENEAGFLTKSFRKMRDRLLGRKKEEDEESGEGKGEGEVKEDDKVGVTVTVNSTPEKVALVPLI